MADGPIVSPDGKHVLVNGEWLELAHQNITLTDSVISGDVSMSSTVNINTRSASEEITNLAELSLLKIINGDMADVNEFYLEAKKIDVDLAIETFENEYALPFGKAYTNLAEYYGFEIANSQMTIVGGELEKKVWAPPFRNENGENKVTLEWPESVQFEGHRKLPSLQRQMMIAANNAKQFLGEFDGIKELSSENFTTIERDKLKQIYRLGLICHAFNDTILIRTNSMAVCLPYEHGLYDFFSDLRRKANDGKSLGEYGTSWHYPQLTLGEEKWVEFLESNYDSNPIIDWEDEFSYMILDYFKTTRKEVELRQQQTWYEKPRWNDDCFVATAAYGTPFADDIDILRMWRDYELKNSKPGRIFVKYYYSLIGPFFAWFISKSVILKYITRQLLKPIVHFAGKGNEEKLRVWRIQRNDSIINERTKFS